MFNDKCYALMRGQDIYSLKPVPAHVQREFHLPKWQGFKNGHAWRYFKTKADFELAVRTEPLDAPLGPHARDAFQAEAVSTWKGNQILDAIRDQYRRKKGK